MVPHIFLSAMHLCIIMNATATTLGRAVNGCKTLDINCNTPKVSASTHATSDFTARCYHQERNSLPQPLTGQRVPRTAGDDRLWRSGHGGARHPTAGRGEAVRADTGGRVEGGPRRLIVGREAVARPQRSGVVAPDGRLLVEVGKGRGARRRRRKGRCQRT